MSWQPGPPEPPPFPVGRVFLRLLLPVIVFWYLSRSSLAWWYSDASLFFYIALVAIPITIFAISRSRTRVWSAENVADLDPNDPRRLPVTRPALPATLAPPLQWTGGASIPTDLGMRRLRSPAASLQIVGDRVILGNRSRLIGPYVPPMEIPVSAVDLVFPARWRFHVGVGIKPRGMPAGYLWTGDRDRILWTLAAQGFPMSSEERRITRPNGP